MADAAWARFLQVADSKREVTDEDLRKIVTVAEPNGHPPHHDQTNHSNHVADALRHMIFG